MAHRTIQVAGRRVPWFTGNWSRVVGWLMCDGKLINRQPGQASLVVDGQGRVSIGKFEKLPADARHAVSGSQQVLTSGRVTARGNTRVPRTAAGISADGTRLVLLVVDGRRDGYSVGITEMELAEEMLRLGCADALNLDGGGSSTLVMKDDATGLVKLLNRPSDGHDLPIPLRIERPVACVLGAKKRP
jgi:exopolysaccharide biosynthesis protein